MKRSEMVKLLTDFLKGADLVAYQLANDKDILAEEILKEIEQAGMLPPDISSQHCDDWGNPIDEYPIHTWETEDNSSGEENET